ncbi:MAG: hypothetical protein IKF38_04990 [Clostridia bacterium]|nr:hypothetical protein [Clostridia bacterium]
MIVKDLSKSFHPCPKNGTQIVNKVENVEKSKVKKKTSKKTSKKNKKEAELKTDFCIMPPSTRYSLKRTKKYCERHEAIFGRAYRFKSIQDGLIVFLTQEDHTGTNGVHGKNGDKLNRLIKKNAQKAWMEYYKKTKEEWIERYGQNYL